MGDNKAAAQNGIESAAALLYISLSIFTL